MRIISFNIASARYAPIEEIALFLDALEPDIVFAQEVDRFTSRSKGVDQHGFLTQLLGSAQAYFSPTIGTAFTGYYGTATYLRQPFAEKISRYNLTVKGDRESRFAIEAKLTSSASEMFGCELISNIHLSVDSAVAEVQLKKLLDRYADSGAYLIGGDFNLRPEAVARFGYPDKDAIPTCGLPARTRKLDRFITTSNRPYRTHTVTTEHLSDHDAVILDI